MTRDAPPDPPAARRRRRAEVAPCPRMLPALRARLVADAIALARAADYRGGVGTVEFLVDAATFDDGEGNARYAFLEVNSA